MTAIAELAEDRVVEGVYAVARKQRLRTKGGAPYLALELVDPSGRIDARVWNDVELLDARFAEGDAVRVLGRVERFRDRLQLDVRSLEPAPRPTRPRSRRRCAATRDELDGFLEFLAGEIAHPGLRATVARFVATRRCGRGCARCRRRRTGHHSYAGGLLEHTVGVATICRETAQLHPRLRGRPAARGGARCTTSAGRVELGPAPAFRRPTRAGCSGTSISGCGWSRSAPTRSTGRGARRAPARDRLPPRLARCADGRGGGALPREPARRGRRDPPRRGQPCSRSGWRSRRACRGASATSSAEPRRGGVSAITVLAISEVAGWCSPGSWCRPRASPGRARRRCGRSRRGLRERSGSARSTAGWPWARSASSRRSSGASAVIPVGVGIATGDRPSGLQLGGVVFALVGVVLASRERVEGRVRIAAGVGLALLAAAGFGLYFVFIDHAADHGAIWAATISRSTASVLAVGAALALGRLRAPAAAAARARAASAASTWARTCCSRSRSGTA